MVLALNGSLIVALLFWWGVHTNEPIIMGLAMASACTSWVANLFDWRPGEDRPGIAYAGVVASVASVVAGLAAIAWRLMG